MHSTDTAVLRWLSACPQINGGKLYFDCIDMHHAAQAVYALEPRQSRDICGRIRHEYSFEFIDVRAFVCEPQTGGDAGETAQKVAEWIALTGQTPDLGDYIIDDIFVTGFAQLSGAEITEGCLLAKYSVKATIIYFEKE